LIGLRCCSGRAFFVFDDHSSTTRKYSASAGLTSGAAPNDRNCLARAI
jgi:hypothetical protein